MKKLFSILFFASSLFSNSAFALKLGGHVKASFVSETKSIQPGQPFTLAVRLEMQKDWHTYWVNPAESGAPTKIKWQLPAGFSAGPIQWPQPKKIVVPPVTTYGYENQVWLLTELTAPARLKAGERVTLKAHVDWLECSVECIPGWADIAITLPVSSKTEPDKLQMEEFSKTRARLPIKNSEWAFSASANSKSIRISLIPPPWHKDELKSVEFFSEITNLVDYAAPQKLLREHNRYTLEIPKSESSTSPTASLRGVLVAEPGWRGEGSETAAALDIPVGANPIGPSSRGLLTPLLFAFLGGLLLNLMPCVLPVLSIKILSFVQHQPHDRMVGVRQSLAFGAGVLASFWLLAGLLFFLRASGEQLGWGFQMQSPLFVLLLISLFFMLGLNLFGIFEVGVSLTKLGDISSKTGSYGKSFLSGALTTLVATPCTAPFMGSALGYALSQPAAIAFGIFTSLGVGVAAPYIVLSSYPALLRFVPKPGAWMETLKQALGFFMMATVLWLLWVIESQRSGLVIPVLVVLLFHGVAAWILGRWDVISKPSRVRTLALLISVSLVVLSLCWGGQMIRHAKPPTSNESISKENLIAWEPFSPEAVSKYRSQGRPVFVDFTASWCLTCQVNERVALNAPEVVAKFKEKNIVPLRADWTSYDPVITTALQAFERTGVPCYVLYSSKLETEPTTLPEILTPRIVLDALDKIN
jgi:thiol:disulfide interchange protein DsbD